ncbi:MAG: inverse autotransporter beta domain-containing protein [Hyphomicrobiales bacterium]|nr:inverse autotransporter beta domain-containing protein [Hyphomicrobiales bacterium]
MFPHKLLLPLGALLLSGLVGASSSGAQDALFVRTQGEIERLWSSALGCAERGSSFAIRDRFNGSESTYGSLPAGGSSDYSQCGERALRNTSSRMLVDTIEDAVRSGGLSLFNSDFRLDSSINWIWGENVTGDLDAVVPLLLIGKEDQGSGHALFLQPGLSFWPGLEDERRLDGNLGVVYRTRMADGLVAGGSFFYDYDVKNDNRRIGVGLDLQDRALHAGLNYYHPLNEWQEGRTDYEEQPLQGGDFRLGLALQRAWLDASMGVWRFEGEGKTKWRPSLGMDAGIRILPGVFLKGGYEWQDEDDSFGTRWSTGLAFRFALPGLDGAGSFNSPPVPAPNLFDPVEREKRILYEEREAVPKANLSVSGTGNTRNVIVQLDEIFTEDVVLNFIGSGSATYNDDWTMSVGGTDCAAVTGTNCQVTVMAGETSPSDGVVITFQDPDRGEPAEDIILSVEIASTGVDLAPGNPLIVQIPAGLPLPNISLSSDKTSIAEGDTATITLTLSEMLGDAAAFNLIGSSDSNDVTYGTSTDDDWNLSIGGTDCDMASGTSCQVTIAAGATSAEVTVEVNADTTNETSVEAFTVSVAVDSGSRNIVQTGSRSTLNFTIPADPPLPTVSLNRDKTSIAEGDTAIITLTLSEMLGDAAAFNLIGGSDSNDVTYGASNDWNLSIDGTDCDMASGMNCQVTIAGGATSAEVTVEVNADTINETSAEAFTVSVEVDSKSRSIVQTGSRSTLNFTIPADPPLPTVSLNRDKTSIAEGDTAIITLTLSEMLGDAAAFNLIGGSDSNDVTYGASNDWNLSIDGTDCDMASGMNCQVTIAGGATSAEVTVEVNADTINETSAEAFTVSVEVDSKSRSIVQTGSRSTLNFTIPEDPPSTLGFAETGITTDETISAGSQFIQLRGVAKDADGMKFSSIPVRIPITISITNNAGNDITIDTSPGQALTPANTDNFNSDNEVLIQAIRIVDDTDTEDQEEFVITLGEGPGFPAGWAIDPDADTFTITINKNDQPSTLGFAETGITTDETISAGSQFIQLRGVAKDADGMKFSSIPVRIPITISITNNAGNDITIDTSPGQALTPANTDNFNSDNEFLIQAIRIVDDTDAEEQEEFVVTLGEGPSFPSGWAIDPDADTFTITINRNDQPSTLGFAGTGITTDETISTGNQFIQIRGVAKDADGMKFSSIPVRIPITISITNNAGNDITIDTSPGQALTPANTDNFNSDNEFLIQAIRIVDDTDAEEQEEFVVTLGEGPSFPDGWVIDSDADTFTIVINGNDRPTVFFSGGDGTQSVPRTITDTIDEGAGGSATVTLNLSPAPTTAINIPLTVTGNHAVYGDVIIANTTRAAVLGNPSTNDVRVSVPANIGMVILRITVVQDSGNNSDDITVSLGALPGDYAAGTNNSWAVAINFPRTVNFAYEGEHSLRTSTNPETAEVADLSLELSKTHNEDITVHLNKGGTAGATNGDYRILNQDGSICGADNEVCVVTFPPGQKEAVVKFWPRRYFSGSETAIINIQIPEGSKDSVQLGKQDEIQFNLIDGTASAVLPTVTLSYTGDRILTSSTTSEIAEIVDLKVQLNNSSSVPIAVHLNKGGTTRAGSGDYRILNADDSICGNDDESCIVTFLAGQTEVVVKFWPRRYIAEQETAVIELEVPAENRDKVALGLNNRVEFTLVPGI